MFVSSSLRLDVRPWWELRLHSELLSHLAGTPSNEEENPRRVCVERDLKAHPVPHLFAREVQLLTD